MYEPKRVSEAYYNQRNSDRERKLKTWRSTNRQWDYILCIVCTGCGKPLGRYENLNRLAFCHSCREILFPETVAPRESHWKNSPY